MAKRSAIDTLPEDIRRALERRLSENGFANYTELTDPPSTATARRSSGVLRPSKPAPKPRA